MTKDEINIAAAEARGWNAKPSPWPRGESMGVPAKFPEWNAVHQLPNIHSDANAQRDAFLEMKEQKIVFTDLLIDKSKNNSEFVANFFTHFGECYLKALGKWREA